MALPHVLSRVLYVMCEASILVDDVFPTIMSQKRVRVVGAVERRTGVGAPAGGRCPYPRECARRWQFQ